MIGVRRLFEYAALLTALLLTIDVWISVGLTCQQIGNHSASAYYSVENCGLFDGPIVAGLIWFAQFFDEHHEAVVAAFTIVLALSTIGLWSSANDLYRAGERQVRFAQQEFAATHRPKIIVHSIEFRPVPYEREEDDWGRIGASILCFNKGETAAINVEARGEILSAADLGIDVQRRVVKSFAEVSSGQKLRFEIESEWPIRELVPRQQQKLPPFHCVGTVVYLDQNNRRRETGFCFVAKVDARGERWISAESPEHEYDY